LAHTIPDPSFILCGLCAQPTLVCVLELKFTVCIVDHQAKRISNILSDRKVSDPQMQNTNAPSNSLQNPMSRGFFINTQFHGNVTFNFCSSESKNVSQIVQHNSVLSVAAAARSPRDSRKQCSQSPILPNYKRIRMLSDSESD